jgi:AdoMet-dependent heme synthase
LNNINGTPELSIIAWEITRRCMMDCRHCRAGEKPATAEHELSTRECLRLVDEMVSFASPVVMITGGEPMLRDDLPEIIHYLSGKGIGTTLSPCGPLVKGESLSVLKDAGLGYISFSIDAIDPAAHDSFRRYPGAFASVLKGIAAAKKAGLPFAILTTVTRHNVNDLPRIIRFAGDLGAAFFIPFFLVATGKGKTIRHHQLSPAAYEACLNRLLDLSTGRHTLPAGCDMVIRPGCAPHFYRIVHQREGSYQLSFFDTPITDGCLAGISFLFISYRGIVQPCGYLDLPCGDVRRESLNTIWNTSPVFQNIRNPHAYQGKCGVCEFLSVCRGCRARAHAESGNYMHEDPFCSHRPASLTMPRQLTETITKVTWCPPSRV